MIVWDQLLGVSVNLLGPCHQRDESFSSFESKSLVAPSAGFVRFLHIWSTIVVNHRLEHVWKSFPIKLIITKLWERKRGQMLEGTFKTMCYSIWICIKCWTLRDYSEVFQYYVELSLCCDVVCLYIVEFIINNLRIISVFRIQHYDKMLLVNVRSVFFQCSQSSFHVRRRLYYLLSLLLSIVVGACDKPSYRLLFIYR